MAVSCNVWDAHMGPMTAMAVPFYYKWFWILKLVALRLALQT